MNIFIILVFILINFNDYVKCIMVRNNVWIFNNWNLKNWKKEWNIKKISYGENNIRYINNPYNKSEIVLKIMYPKGSYKPTNKRNIGGVGFYAEPLLIPKKDNIIITFQYDIFFEDNFKWNKGGKLPGLYGGHDECSGGINAGTNKCFSTRYMWRKNGLGESYLYIPRKQKKSLCNDIIMGCKSTGYGYSIGRGKFIFNSGKWNTLKQEIKLNTKPGLSNGYLKIFFNNKSVINENKIDYKMEKDVYTIGIDFETFFGGGDKSYATVEKQYTLFKNFILKYSY